MLSRVYCHLYRVNRALAHLDHDLEMLLANELLEHDGTGVLTISRWFLSTE